MKKNQDKSFLIKATLAFIFLLSGCGGGSEDTNSVPIDNSSDKLPPAITILGENPTSIETGSEYTDAGASATDNIDGQVEIRQSGTVNTSMPGTYEIIYSATDAAGNTATATRVVLIVLPVNKVIPIAAVEDDEITERFGLDKFMAIDSNQNEILVYIESSVDILNLQITEGIDNGTPTDAYNVKTNGFIKIDYGLESEDLHIIRIRTNSTFNTLFVKNTTTLSMNRTPYEMLDDELIEFRAVPINGQIEFALYNID
jgi:hypothetical protein